ncbi:unnamed protein product [Bemisia tabaci]|uniref:Vacuolar protein sorting-associated protein 54 n=1 Tax=Bemisia tabaci TaxID=7038 RepID=A0A9P0F6D7_BEMTA|nr:unnamed protein product [Bemisia tabaci]
MESPVPSTARKKVFARCEYCVNITFPLVKDFLSHLREIHCSKEGGSFVCRYGENGVCSSLPVEGVSDEDYERHVYKHHALTIMSGVEQRKISTASNASNSSNDLSSLNKWSLYSASQNLAAVLNDPNKGKKRDFFTKTWGDSFVEVSNVPPPNYLPNITISHFQSYLKKFAKRCKAHEQISSLGPKPPPNAELLQHFPELRVSKTAVEKSHFDLSLIPKIYLQLNFDLNQVETFNAVFPHIKEGQNNFSQSADGHSPKNSAKLLQEQLSHYLDIVEVLIAQQVSAKSDAFFDAMTSHDALMEQLTQTISTVQTLRKKIREIENNLVKESFLVMRANRSRNNQRQVLKKLRQMAVVLQTKPNIHMLLAIPDYVAALDLIHTTQDLLSQELAGIHSFRNLNSELNEMLFLIDNLMAGEFQKYATTDLNRPLLDSQANILEEMMVLSNTEKLSCIVLGMLRRRYFDFVDAYRQEVVDAIRAAVNSCVTEIVARSESDHHGSASEHQSLDNQLKFLTVEEWIQLMRIVAVALSHLVKRIKAAHDVMKEAVEVSRRKTSSSDKRTEPTPECFLSEEDYERMIQKLKSLMSSCCKYAQDRCAQLLSSRSVTNNESRDKDRPNLNSDSSPSFWLAEQATQTQLSELSKSVDILCNECEAACADNFVSSLRSAFKSQSNSFMQRFHSDKTTKLRLILDSETWKQAEVPIEFQFLVNQIAESGKFSVSKEEQDRFKLEQNGKSSSTLVVGNEHFAVVGTVLILISMVADYCIKAEDLTLSAQSLLRYVSELLQLYNARSSQLVLGAEAVAINRLRKITSTNLALALRAIQLLLWLIPFVKLHFQGLISETTSVTSLDTVAQKMKTHARDIQGKLISIVNQIVDNELRSWEAKPPIPSKSFQNLCKYLCKLHEAIACVLPKNQVHELYRLINVAFKDSLRNHLLRMNIINNGGPQHGMVTSELTFYLEDLKRISALPEEELTLSAMDDIWIAQKLS